MLPDAPCSEGSSTGIYILLRDVLVAAELAALPRRSECAASGVAQLQGRHGDHHFQRDPPDAGSARNADPDYKHQHERGRWKKDKDLMSQSKHRAAEKQPQPPNEGAALAISLCLLWDRH
jgi:hypothetical protein